MAALSSQAAALLILLIPLVSAQSSQCAPDGSPKLRFVAQLNVSGCALFVHDTGAIDGPHLAVEPIMCVTENLHQIVPQYEVITEQMYVSVPVTLRDDAMLAVVQRQLRHLSPKSVKFVTVSDISVSTDNSSKLQALEFIWSPEETVGFLRLGCKSAEKACSFSPLTSRIRQFQFEAFEEVNFSAAVISDNTVLRLMYRPTIQNRSFFDPEIHMGRFECLHKCQKLRFIRSIRLKNCTARVHQRVDMKGHFLIEPLLCHNITRMSSESVRYDFSRDKYYLKFDVVLQDDTTEETVRTQLADLSPRSVAFMRLWRAQSDVALALSRRFEIGPLKVSGDGRSAQLRVYCMHKFTCRTLLSTVITRPVDFWKYVRYILTSVISDQCISKSAVRKHPWRMKEERIAELDPGPTIILTPDGRMFMVIQQRLTGTVSFQRTWTEYEEGFGDETDFWVGLKKINSLTGRTPRLLRVEAVTWSDKLYVCEYSGFAVSDASTDYEMTVISYLGDSSNTTHRSFEQHGRKKFSTFDKDPSNNRCSMDHGRSGWWYGLHHCGSDNPNGLYKNSAVHGQHNMFWYGADGHSALKSIRLMLQT